MKGVASPLIPEHVGELLGCDLVVFFMLFCVAEILLLIIIFSSHFQNHGVVGVVLILSSCSCYLCSSSFLPSFYKLVFKKVDIAVSL